MLISSRRAFSLLSLLQRLVDKRYSNKHGKHFIQAVLLEPRVEAVQNSLLHGHKFKH